MTLASRYKQIQETLAAAAKKSRRAPGDVTLVAVTKGGTLEQIRELVGLGHRDLGESRVQQLQIRAEEVRDWLSAGGTGLPTPDAIRWHMIGHLQRNKVKPVLQLCSYVHSVDSLRLAEEIAAAGPRVRRMVPMLLEINVSGEASKFGIAPGAALHLAEQIDTMDGVQLAGLMTMAPHSDNPEDARPHFARLRELFDEIRARRIGGPHFKHLSMGMSGDYRVAVEEGATMVRIGTALFGEAEEAK